MKIVIADDSLLVREGLARLLAEAGVQVVATAADAPQLLRELNRVAADAAIVDIRMPPTFTTEGLDAAHAIRDAFPGMGIVVLSQFLESGYASQLLGQAPEHLGYLLKDRVTDVAVILDALHRVIEGECVLDPTIVTTLIRRPRDPGPLSELTARERDVLALMAEGRSNTAIAQRLFVSAKTLETHVSRIFHKLHLTESSDDHRRVLAVLAFLQQPQRPG
ncbi:MAG TPA: response regulator transcription factor [Mycobacterium sp.]|nr:response regulator transcription factor [Mycobacterium sp.]